MIGVEIGVGVALLAAAALLVAGLAARFVQRPVRLLTEAARRMAQGDLQVRVRAGAAVRGELGDLGQALDRMAENLSQTLSQLREERDLLDGILSGMQEGVLLLDREGHAVLVNPALREMLLLPLRVVGLSQLEVIRHAELKDLIDRVRAPRATAAASAEIEVLGLKPRRLWVHATRLPERRVLLVFVDVTDMRRLESLRRDFVANASHELRTPVTAVRSAAETLREAVLKDPQAAPRFLDIIDRNAERLQHLLEDLLDLSRIESRAYLLKEEDLAVAAEAQRVLALFREQAARRRLLLRQDIPEGLLPARGDRRAFEQVLSNLIDNALKYCHEGAEVCVSAAAAAGDRAVRVSVRDTGPGIDERHRPRLFERFYRVDAGRSRDLGGTGLGLSIVKHLVEAMGGEVGVESAVGRGSTFWFTLPAASA